MSQSPADELKATYVSAAAYATTAREKRTLGEVERAHHLNQGVGGAAAEDEGWS